MRKYLSHIWSISTKIIHELKQDINKRYKELWLFSHLNPLLFEQKDLREKCLRRQ